MVRLRSDLLFEGPFTRQEVRTLVGLGPIVEPFRGMFVHDTYESAMTKIADTLTPKDRAELERARERFFCIADGGVLPYGDKRSIVESLRVAADSNRRVEYIYQSAAGNRHSGSLEPFAFGTYRNTVYLLGRPARSQHGGAPLPPWVRWPVHRFLMVSLTREEFTIPEDFKIEDHFNGWGIVAGERRENVVIEFTATVAPLIIERVWHPGQRIDPLPDGRVRLSCEVACTPDLTSWILGYGCDALVVEPIHLRDEVLLQLAKPRREPGLPDRYDGERQSVRTRSRHIASNPGRYTSVIRSTLSVPSRRIASIPSLASASPSSPRSRIPRRHRAAAPSMRSSHISAPCTTCRR